MKQPDDKDELTLSFELGMYELGRELYPKSHRVMDGLVTTYAAAGRHEDAVGLAAELVKADAFNPRYHYNYACSLCCAGRCEEAIQMLKKAVDLGFSDFDFLTRDPDLEPLRDCPEFREYQKRALVQRSQRLKEVD